MVRQQTAIPREAFSVLRRRADIFAERCLGNTLWSKQREILRSVSDNPRTAVKSAHGLGKTFVAAAALIWWMSTRHPAEVISTAPTWRQVEKLLWKEVKLAWGRAVPEVRGLGECLQTALKFGNGHEAYGVSTDDTDRFQGIHSPHLMVIVDEAAGVSQDIYDAIATLGTGGEYRELLIGNPTSTDGRFYEAFRDQRLGYSCISMSVEDSPHWTGEQCAEVVLRSLTTRVWAEERALDWGTDSPLYQSRVLARFPEGDADNILVPLSWAEAAQLREPPEDADNTAQLGLDVARYGNDTSCMAGRVGYNLAYIEGKPGNTGTLDVVGWASSVALQWAARHGSVRVLVDEGYNPGVVDLLLARKDAGVTYEAVAFGGAALDPERHINRRNEMYWGLRELFRSGNSDADLCITATGPAVARFVAQVSAMRYTYDVRLRPKLESKDDMRKRGMPSPDEADAVALAFARPQPRRRARIWT